ncbi:hypothetical protein [Streptomyces sp. NPDC050287]
MDTRHGCVLGGLRNRDPIMAEIILASSHNPWSPHRPLQGW